MHVYSEFNDDLDCIVFFAMVKYILLYSFHTVSIQIPY